MLGSFTLLVALAVAYRKNRMFVWGALGLSYAVLAVQSIEARDMGLQANRQGTAGGVNDWFGLAWSVVWLFNLLVIIVLNVLLLMMRRHNPDSDQHKQPITHKSA